MHLQTSGASLRLGFFARPPPPSPIPCLRACKALTHHILEILKYQTNRVKKKITYNTWSSNYKMLALWDEEKF